MLALKREARRDWQRLRAAQEQIKYNILKAMVKRMVNHIRGTNWNKFVMDTATNLQKTWNLTKILKGSTKKTSTPAIHGQQGMVYTSVDKAKVIAQTLDDQFKPSQIQEVIFNRDVIRTRQQHQSRNTNSKLLLKLFDRTRHQD
uniref:Uncharacterized protein n=1 Tax=Timema tahoe TaxID=61484 RepID=A0A7R9FI25_9NEOP|nr:unnamed protein product [Timema tahoe]